MSGETQRVSVSAESHPDHGWRWRVALLTGAGATLRPADVVAQGCAPTEALALRRAGLAYEVFTADYPGHYEISEAS